MRRKLSLVLTLTAWLLATGSHWDLVQTFAYARMFADKSAQQNDPGMVAIWRMTESLVIPLASPVSQD